MTKYIDTAPIGMMIVDIDGTMSNDIERRSKLARDHDLMSYHKAFDMDMPTKHASHIWKFMESAHHNDMLFFVTMRPEELMEPTIEWLAYHISAKFLHYLDRNGPDPEDTFIMYNKNVENANLRTVASAQSEHRVKQVKQCYERRDARASEWGLKTKEAVMFEDNIQNAIAVQKEFPGIVIFSPYITTTWQGS